jgi:spore coat polysaccharide biosynthesis protein SpsF
MFKTEQENFWAGEFGSEYIKRNKVTPEDFAARLSMFAKITSKLSSPASSILELGANIGGNLRALATLLPSAHFTGVEINPQAADILRKLGDVEVIETSLFDFSPKRKWDLVFTSGVLIHLNPELLPNAYDIMAKHALRYVCMVEYYNPTPVNVIYRGNFDKLFKRDFAGEFLDIYPEFILEIMDLYTIEIRYTIVTMRLGS